MRRGSSRRLIWAPTSVVNAISGGPDLLPARKQLADASARLIAVDRAGGRLDDVFVAGAAADIAAQSLADLGVGRLGDAAEEVDGAHDHPRGTIPALQTMLLPKRFLHRMKRLRRADPFDRRNARPVGLHGEHRTALHRNAVDEDRACAAARRVATDVRPGQPQVLAEEVDEKQARLDLRGNLLAVDLDLDLVHTHLT